MTAESVTPASVDPTPPDIPDIPDIPGVVARLRDAKFFWDADRKVRLEDRLERLHTIVFHKKLPQNSYRDKAERVAKLARRIVAEVLGAAEHADHAEKAALRP